VVVVLLGGGHVRATTYKMDSLNWKEKKKEWRNQKEVKKVEERIDESIPYWPYPKLLG
jgi:hypothetical protein